MRLKVKNEKLSLKEENLTVKDEKLKVKNEKLNVKEENLNAKCRNCIKENKFLLSRTNLSNRNLNSNKPLKNFQKELSRFENFFSMKIDEISKSISKLSTRLEISLFFVSKLQQIKNSNTYDKENKLKELILMMKNYYEETHKILCSDKSKSESKFYSTNLFENLNQMEEFPVNVSHSQKTKQTLSVFT